MSTIRRTVTKYVVIATGSVALFVAGIVQTAEAREYNPIIDIPGIKEGSFSAYINSLFDIAVLAGAVLAVLVIAVGGLQYMTTDAVSQKKESVTRIQYALIGLLMLLSTYLFFNQINPNILDLNVELKRVPGGQFQGQIRGPNTQDDGSGVRVVSPPSPFGGSDDGSGNGDDGAPGVLN